MLSLRKSKWGFTLIELMVVVAIIGVLALLGLRLYTGQQQKAKNAIVKANAGTIQTLIQAELADTTSSAVNAKVIQAAGIAAPDDNLFEKSGIHIPDGSAQDRNGVLNTNSTDIGYVVVVYDTTTPGSEFFTINGNAFVTGPVFATDLTARK